MQKVTGLIPDAELKLLEAEHGPIVVLSHPDGSVFPFRRMTREQFDTRNNRVKRGEVDADDKMLQERCVAREQWNLYVSNAVFETLAYTNAFRKAHGGNDVSVADDDQIPADGDTSLLWLSNGETFGFRKPGRAEVRMFQANMQARQSGAKQAVHPLETLLLSLSTPDFAAWLPNNLFGVDAFGDALIGAFGMSEVRVSGK
jgi:hypothetical protein